VSGDPEDSPGEKRERARRAGRAGIIAGRAGRRPRLRHLLAALFAVAGFLVAAAGVVAGVYLDKASTEELVAVLASSLAVIVLAGAAVWLALRRVVVEPVASVAADALVVAGGDLDHAVEPTGPREVAEMAAAIEAMRTRILSEVSQARALNNELARSNEELEQFAYVASHDLQEPLRKVTSFCQLLAQRYGGQLDERGEQYIEFAVDGAKRMQVLINDLLAFSRIGRTTDHFEAVDLAECTDIAVRNLSLAIEQAGAEVRVEGALPKVMGDRSLLVALMQNLIANAVKFRGDSPPQVAVSAEAGEDDWTVSVADNGIGVEPRFADRIFVIFQRLHGREAYAGTGIGLAMCRKIVEFHGGRIWLDTGYGPGARFCFTLPKVPTEEPEDERDDATVDAG